MLALKIFLEEHRIHWKERRNFVCLKKATGIFRQGNFHIPANKQADLWKLYGEAAPSFTELNCPTLVYRPPERTVQPLQIDCDLRFVQETKVPVNIHFRFAQKLAVKLVEVCKQTVHFYVVAKSSGYFKLFKSQDKTLFTNGAHMYFSNVRIPKRVARDIKKYAESICLEFYGHLSPVNNPSDIIDRAVVERANGLCLIGTFKGPNQGGRYMLKKMGAVDPDGVLSEAELQENTVFSQLTDIMANTYNFVWEEQQEGDEVEVEEKSQPKPKKCILKPEKHVVNEKLPFNLKKFLEVTSKHHPNHQTFPESPLHTYLYS